MRPAPRWAKLQETLGCLKEALLRQYHERLMGWGKAQRWQLDGVEIRGTLEAIDLEGRLCIALPDGGSQCFSPGEAGWLGMEPDA